MPKIAVIGSNGMLGRAVAARTYSGYKVIEVNRFERPVFSSNQHIQISSDLSSFESSIDFTEIDFVINCAGLIRQKIHEHDPKSTALAMEVNYELPRKLVRLSEKCGFKIFQIGTDCVFSGMKGSYLETDTHDARDIYGKSKSMGEIQHQNLSILRASIVGLETGTENSLLSWFLSQPVKARINGFNDQEWNGVTVFHFSKFLAGIIENREFDAFCGTHHVVPADAITKETLLRYFAEYFNREDIVIKSVESGNKLDMTLATTDRELNNKLWQMAGYSGPLSIEEMILQYSLSIESED